jgi:hypothetical protein
VLRPAARLILAFFLLFGAGVHAAEGPASAVIVFGEPGGGALTNALRIQLDPSRPVAGAKRNESESLDAKIEGARQELAGGGAELAVWVERGARTDQGAEFIVYVVGDRAGRALVEVVRVEGDEGPELYRVIALKVRDVLDEVTIARAEPDLARALVTPRPSPSAIGALVELGGHATLGLDGARSRFAALIGAGAGFDASARRVEVTGVLRLPGNDTTETVDGAVLLREWAPAAEVRLLSPGRVRFGPHLGAALRIVDATGVTTLGTRGASTLLVPAVYGGAEARWLLTEWIALRAASALEVGLIRRELSLNDQPMAELGQVAGSGQISLVLTVP